MIVALQHDHVPQPEDSVVGSNAIVDAVVSQEAVYCIRTKEFFNKLFSVIGCFSFRNYSAGNDLSKQGQPVFSMRHIKH